MPAGQPLAYQASPASQAGLVPDVDHEAVAPLIHLTLALLANLGTEAAVQRYTRAQPGAHRAIRALSAAIAAAGVRVRDSGRARDSFDERLRMFTAGEIWEFDLAYDVLAMLGSLDGLSPGTHARIAGALKTLDQDTHSHHWKNAVCQAGDGPAEFRALRAEVPHRTAFARSWVRTT